MGKKVKKVLNIEESLRRYESLFFVFQSPIKLMKKTLFSLIKEIAYQIFLKKTYDDYMPFLRSGVEHHTDDDGSMAKIREKRHNIDMNQIIDDFDSILDSIKTSIIGYLII